MHAGSKWGKLHRNLDIAAHDAAVEEVAAQVVAEGGDADLVDPLARLVFHHCVLLCLALSSYCPALRSIHL